MRTWRLASFTQGCGFCGGRIAVGATLLELQLETTNVVRCRTCGERMCGEAAPDVIPEEPRTATTPSVPHGLRYQPSLGLEDGQ
jgi:hypothetical protein